MIHVNVIINRPLSINFSKLITQIYYLFQILFITGLITHAMHLNNENGQVI